MRGELDRRGFLLWKNVNVRKRTWEVVITVSQCRIFAAGFQKALFEIPSCN